MRNGMKNRMEMRADVRYIAPCRKAHIRPVSGELGGGGGGVMVLYAAQRTAAASASGCCCSVG